MVPSAGNRGADQSGHLGRWPQLTQLLCWAGLGQALPAGYMGSTWNRGPLVGCLVAFLSPSRCLKSSPLLCPPPMRLALDRPVKWSRGCQGPCGPLAFLTRKEVGKERAQNTKKGHLLPKEIGTKKK